VKGRAVILSKLEAATLYTRVVLCAFALLLGVVFALHSAEPAKQVEPSWFLELVEVAGTADGKLNLGVHLSLERDLQGNLLLSDAEQHQILCQAIDGTMQPLGLRLPGHFRPYGLAISKDGCLYVANPDSHEVLIFNPGGELSAAIGGFGTRLERPIDVAIGEDGRVYVLDDISNVVVVYNAAGVFREGIPLPPDVGLPISLSTSLGEIFVLFAGSPRILRIDSVRSYRWFGDEGYGVGQLKSPSDVAIVDDLLYVVDRTNSAIQVYDTNGDFIREYVLYKRLLHNPLAVSADEHTVTIANAIDQLLRFRIGCANTGIEHAVLGEEYCLLGYYGRSSKEFEKALLLGYDPAEVHFYLGFCYYTLGSYGEAEEQFRVAQEKDPDDVETLFQLANSLYRTGEYPEAAEMYQAVLAYEPGHVQAAYNLGETYLKLGDLEQAESHFNRALELAPGSRDAILGLGRVCMQRGDLPNALRLFKEVLNKAPEDGRAAYYIGLIQFEQGQYKEASKAFEKSAAMGPFFIDSLYHLGLSYLALGQEEEAAVWFQKVLDVAPSHKGARKMLKQIENSN